jgi:Tol biopolymer transport system component
MTARRRIGLAMAALSLLGAAADTAEATAPGRNGSIAFRRFLDPERTQGAIFTIKPDGTGERQVTAPPAAASDDFPDFAADGSLIAFQRCADFCRIFTARPDGSRVHGVGPTCTPSQQPPNCIDATYAALSPDGRRIAFIGRWGRITDEFVDYQDVFTMCVDGSHLRRVTNSPLQGTVYGEPQWSPDGRKLLYVRYEVDGSQAVVTSDVDGGHQRRVTPWALHAGDGPDWSPDGSRILFRSNESDNFLNSDLFTIRTSGTGLEQLTHVSPDTKLYSASFSPDGTSITFGMQGIGGAGDVWRMKADGTGITPLTRTVLHDSAPDWGGR